ncbi:hypothetical protein RHGRI_007444 [Rhododendron griersonianum]|uniref:Uncharacterized protein n=1 Tax=Rhododendron griersonianum TaxID=479676 RepID=A0AAV6KXM0_9ERIC|nr:hypothetical protein RHGRI_007444 [Rhododendron griersonianum]
MPTFRKSAAHWFAPLRPSDVEEPILPELNVPLQTIDPSAKDKLRRNIARPVIPTRTSNPARTRDPSDSQREKRQKTTHDPTPPSRSQPEELRVSMPSVNVPEFHLETREPPTEAVDRWEFSPSYTSPDSRVVLLNDSVKAEPSLAVTLLRGLALPRDVDQVPSELLPSLGEMLDKLLLKPTTRQLAAKRERYKSDQDIARQKGKTWEQQAKTSGAKVERLKNELADARVVAKAAQAKVKKMREEEKEKLKAANLKGYEAGIIRASQ